jgi:hypothetical protein
LFLLFAVSYSAGSLYNALLLIPEAERRRRQQLLSDALGVPLTPSRTAGYYNNPVPPSIKRLGASVLENSFFGIAVCGEMAKRRRLLVGAYFLIWFSAILFRSTDLTIIAALTQALFSTQVLTNHLRLEWLLAKLKRIHSELYNLFLHNVELDENRGMAGVLDCFASYEAAKAAAAIRQSSKIFHRINERRSLEWESMRTRLGIDE